MADIFISYTKPDRFPVEQLAAYLQSEGWSVWWDHSLTAGDSYRDDIMKELTTSRAVIAVWTEASIKSEWVRAEAGRGKADGKLIPVKASNIGYADIPLPFGEMHTEPLENRELIRAAVVSQLAKPIIEQDNFTITKATVKSQLFTWIGIVGGAITLFSSLKGVIELSRWVQVALQYWSDWNKYIWSVCFSWFGWKVSTDVALALSFAVFLLSTGIGAALASRQNRDDKSRNSKYSGEYKKTLFVVFSWYLAADLLCGLFATDLVVDFLMERSGNPDAGTGRFILVQLFFGFLSRSLIFVWALFVCRDFFSSVIYIGLLVVMQVILFGVPVAGAMTDADVLVLPVVGGISIGTIIASGSSEALVPTALAFTRARTINRRLIFLFIGVCLLLGLNILSRLGLERYVQP